MCWSYQNVSVIVVGSVRAEHGQETQVTLSTLSIKLPWTVSSSPTSSAYTAPLNCFLAETKERLRSWHRVGALHGLCKLYWISTRRDGPLTPNFLGKAADFLPWVLLVAQPSPRPDKDGLCECFIPSGHGNTDREQATAPPPAGYFSPTWDNIQKDSLTKVNDFSLDLYP